MFFEVFASPKGSGARAHFDHEMNFNVLLRGLKRWTLAPNRAVINPLEACALDSRLSPFLSACMNSPLPKTLPRHSVQITARPGTSVFLPRGEWHRTVALQESFGVVCGIQPPTWSELLIANLERHLLTKADFRSYAIGFTGGSNREYFDKELAHMHKALRTIVNILDTTKLTKELKTIF